MLPETILRWVIEYGAVGIFSLLALGIIGAPIPDEGVLAFAGYLVFEGKLQLFPIVAAAFLGSAAGITLSYGLGRTLGIYLGVCLRNDRRKSQLPFGKMDFRYRLVKT